MMWKPVTLLLPAVAFLMSCQSPTIQIPVLDTRGDVYKTEGPNDPLIYDSTIGEKKAIMLYADFPDAVMKINTKERAKGVLGNGKFQELFHEQSYGKMTLKVEHVHGWRRLSKSAKEYSSKTTESHRELFVEIFDLYPQVDFLAYDYIMVNMPRIGNTAFGERDDLAIPYRGKKINVALNISSNSPYVLAHETAHLMGLPDLYTYGGVEGPKNPAGPWDIMSSAGRASGFLGWHRHKFKWLDANRKTYITSGTHRFELTPLNASTGVSMITIPADDPVKPSKVFVVEISQPIQKQDKDENSVGVLVYSVDATLATGQNPVIVYPKTDLVQAPFQPGDVFGHKDAPMSMKVLKQNADGSFLIEVTVK
ncbi:MAG: hypothetical protein MK183_01795 [Verrucomicrobiales bacterium]|nr:hypothetical protein [Verrucomicrobiales bacterium]